MPMCRVPRGLSFYPGERVEVGTCGPGTIRRDPGPASNTVDVFLDEIGQVVPVARVLIRVPVGKPRLVIDNSSNQQGIRR